jgi:hypothetical protein
MKEKARKPKNERNACYQDVLQKLDDSEAKSNQKAQSHY